MSRCYPYQPTVSLRNRASVERTIKLHCKNKKSKTESLIENERKLRKEKKEKHYDFCDGKVKKLCSEKCYRDEKNRGLLVGYLSKGSEDEAERLDKSDITDEHDEPVCYLSDGTQSGSKRKRQSSPCIIPSAVPSTTASITVRDNIIRIRLSSQRHSETDELLSNRQSCSTSGRVANSTGQPQEILRAQDQKCWGTVDNTGSPVPHSVRKESILQVGGKPAANGNILYENKVQESIVHVGGKHAANRNTLHENKVQITESIYESLIEDWVPPPFRSVLDEADDEEWLCVTQQQQQELKRLKTCSDFLGVSCQQNSTMRPCAHYSLEADTYALPYTIPY